MAFLNKVGHTIFVQIEAMATDSGQELVELNNSLEERITQNLTDLRQKDQMLILQGRRAAMGETIGNIINQT